MATRRLRRGWSLLATCLMTILGILAFAPSALPQDQLGSSWDDVEPNGWTAVWTRNTVDTFDAVFTRGSESFKAEIHISFAADGIHVTAERWNLNKLGSAMTDRTPDCTYSGMVDANGLVNGTGFCPAGNYTPWTWRATIHGYTPHPPVLNLSRKVATIRAVTGDVEILHADGTSTNARVSGQLTVGDTIKTGYRSTATLDFGTRGTVTAEEMTEWRMATFTLLPGDAIDVVLELKAGALNMLHVTKDVVARTSFRVKSPTTAASVRGTTFSVRHDARSQVTTVSVREGIVDVTPTNKSLRPFSLRAGQQVQVSQTRVGPITAISGSTNPSGTTLPPQPQRPANVNVWAGDWVTTLGPMRLDQNGLQVSGVYTAFDGSNNKLTGTVSGTPSAEGQSALNGQFTVTTNVTWSGSFTFTLSSDGRRFSGVAPALVPNGNWNGCRPAPCNP